MQKKRYLHSKLAIATFLALPAIGLADPIACTISPLAKHIMPERDYNLVPNGQMIVEADDGYLNDFEGDVSGNVEVFNGDAMLASERFKIDRINQVVTSEGDTVRYATPSTVLIGTKMIHLLNKQETHVTSGTYYMRSEPNVQGRATQIDHRSNEQNTLLKNATYSACSVDNEIWKIKAKDIDIDHDGGRAVATNAVFDVLGVPLLYTPYISFPIDGKRHSGFLFPEFEISRSNGVEFFLPYYFNIAPNMDAILSAGFIAKRSPAVKGNFRYLNEWQTLNLEGTYLFRDKLYDNRKRWMIKADSEFELSPNLSGDILFQNVSDDNYIFDIEDETGLYRGVTLDRHATLNYRTENWETMLRVQDFLVTDREIIQVNPYSRMPQLLFRGGWDVKGIGFDLDAEFVRFDVKETESRPKNLPTGATRIDIMPSVSYRLENSWGFIVPTARLRYTHYNISYHNDRANTGQDTSISRTLPIISLDAGLFFDRETTFSHLFGGGDFIQTIEPRAYYLYAPFRSQTKIPIFDTSRKNSGFDNLFGYNDFYGADRQSDANRLTTSLTTRIIEESTGSEKFFLTLAQTQYFTSPRVTIGRDYAEGENIIKRSSLSISSGVSITNNIRTTTDLEWSPENKKVTYGTFDLSYRPATDKIFSIGYRYNKGVNATEHIDQIDTSFYWSLNNKWAIAGRYNYAISENIMIDSQLGVEFRDCCVTTRVAARYFRNNMYDEQKQWRVYVEFDLSGIGSVGQNTDQLWKDTISGYTSRQGRYF